MEFCIQTKTIRVSRPNRKSTPYIKIVTCLSIGEYTSVVSLKRIIKDISPEAVENVLLGRIVGQFWIQREETMIKRERLRLFPENQKWNVKKKKNKRRTTPNFLNDGIVTLTRASGMHNWSVLRMRKLFNNRDIIFHTKRTPSEQSWYFDNINLKMLHDKTLAYFEFLK